MSGGATRLYTRQVLGLATRLAEWPLDPAMPHQGRARSASCGSSLSMSLATDDAGDDAGQVTGIGLSAQACAVGQACAAIFAAEALGKTRAEIAAAEASLTDWLTASAPIPHWPGLDAIAAARDYPGRHGAILLPWRAALDALSESRDAS